MAGIAVDFVDCMGSDLTVVNAARVSFDKESHFEGISGHERLGDKDAKLIQFLATHGHWTPFGHPQITLRETVPIFVARQRFKHMVGFVYNEVSRRYVDSEPEFYTPSAWRKRAENKKQGSSDEPVTKRLWMNGADGFKAANTGLSIEDWYESQIQHALHLYNGLLDAGVCPEQARMVLPQSMLTSYYVTGSLAAWARFYKQRTDPHAQKEIQDLAHKVGAIIAPKFPVSWKALTN